MAPSFLEYFTDLPDPRKDRGRRHKLGDIVVIAVCAVICSADDWMEVAEFGEAKEPWLRTFLELPHGIPSHDTFNRVFGAMDAEALERCFMLWIKALAGANKSKLVAIDGKTLRRSIDRAHKKAAIHMVSAWASENELVFAQLATEAKSNEITAIPKLLELLDLAGVTVTIDAMGCQREIARKITEKGGDYVLALKENQATLYEEAKLFLDEIIDGSLKGIVHEFHEQTESDHGRVETRRVWCTAQIDWFEDRVQWPGLTSFAAVECERAVGEKTTCERRYFISSIDGRDAQAMAHAVRSHWGIENKLHWSLDVSFAEDQSRMRKKNTAENFSRLRRIALNLLKQDKTKKVGIKAKRRRAGWDEDYLLHVLTQ